MQNQVARLNPSDPVDGLHGTQRQMKYAQRPILTERPTYEPACPQEEFIVPLLRRHIEAALAKYAKPSAGAERALDVGCGRQPFRRELELAGYIYVSMDAQQNPEGSVDFVCAIDEELPARFSGEEHFQFVLCTEVLEHVADWDMAFKNLALLLSHGGRALITCPHFYQLHEEPYDFWRPTLHALTFFAQREGFRIIDKAAAGDAWDVLGTVVANCRPALRIEGVLGRSASKVLVLVQKCVFRLLRSRVLQQSIRLNGPLYLSNVVILERI